MLTVYIILAEFTTTLKLGLFLSDVYLNHLMTIILSVFLRGYRGKTVNFALTSNSHRTTIAHFLNDGKWDDDQLQSVLKASIVEILYSEARKSKQPVLCIVDDTIASHTKPSSRALHPIEAAYFHQSHLKGHQDYGHQILAVMLACNGMIFNYAIILYDKSKSKIQLVQNIAAEHLAQLYKLSKSCSSFEVFSQAKLGCFVYF